MTPHSSNEVWLLEIDVPSGLGVQGIDRKQKSQKDAHVSV